MRNHKVFLNTLVFQMFFSQVYVMFCDVTKKTFLAGGGPLKKVEILFFYLWATADYREIIHFFLYMSIFFAALSDFDRITLCYKRFPGSCFFVLLSMFMLFSIGNKIGNGYHRETMYGCKTNDLRHSCHGSIIIG